VCSPVRSSSFTSKLRKSSESRSSARRRSSSAVVGGQGCGHDGPRTERAVDGPGTLDDAAEADDRNLRREDHTVDGLNALLAEVG
jgi:hypothetical protein